MKFDKVISLGTCCACSFIIDKFFPDQLRHPFDWLSINNVECISSVLKEDFKDFTVESREQLPWKPSETSSKLCASRYPIWAVHGYNQDSLNRRVERFRNTVNSDENVLFIIVGHIDGDIPMYCCPNINIDQAIELRDTLYTVKKDKKFHLCVINESLEPKDTIKMENLSINYVNGSLNSDNYIIKCNYDGKYDNQLKNIFELVSS